MPRVTTPPHPPGSRHWGPAETSSIEPRNSHYSPIVSLLYGIPFPDSVEYRAVLLGANEGLRLRTKVPTAAGFLPPFRRRDPASAAIANAFIMVSRCPHCPLRLGPPRILDPAHPAPEKYLLAAAKWAAHNAFSTPRIQSRIDLRGSSLFHFSTFISEKYHVRFLDCTFWSPAPRLATGGPSARACSSGARSAPWPQRDWAGPA